MIDVDHGWINAILNKAEDKTDSDGCGLILYSHGNDAFSHYSGDIEVSVDDIRGSLRQSVYSRERHDSSIGDFKYTFFPVVTQVGPIGVLVFENHKESLSEGFGLVGRDQQSARDATSIIGKILADSLFDRIGSLSTVTEENNPSGIETPLPVGKHECVVMFVDFRSLTLLLSECNDDRVVYDIIDEFINIIGNATKKHYGVVNKYMGAGALILFGVSIDDQVINDNKNISILRALCAASRIKKRFQSKENEWYDKLRKKFPKKKFEHVFKSVDIGVGINAQRTRLLTVGTSDRYNYSCFGENVAFAKSIESISGREEHKGEGWNDKPGYCSILFSTLVEFRLNNLTTSSVLNSCLDIDIIDDPQEVDFDRLSGMREVKTFKKIEIGQSKSIVEPQLNYQNSIVSHEFDDGRWKVSISNK
jgi:class 3 adenylate cyclase